MRVDIPAYINAESETRRGCVEAMQEEGWKFEGLKAFAPGHVSD